FAQAFGMREQGCRRPPLDAQPTLVHRKPRVWLDHDDAIGALHHVDAALEGAVWAMCGCGCGRHDEAIAESAAHVSPRPGPGASTGPRPLSSNARIQWGFATIARNGKSTRLSVAGRGRDIKVRMAADPAACAGISGFKSN